MRRLLWILILTSLGCSPLYAAAAPAIALGYQPKYAPGFKAFDYVNPNAPKGGRLVLPALGSFDTLNPFTLKGDKESGITALTVETLMDQGEEEPFTMYGLLADDVSLAPDRLSVTFHLNPRARFQNGQPVTAADVAFSFNTLTKDPAVTPMYRFYWADVKSAVIVDPLRVRFEFKRPNAELHMILGQLPVFSRQWIKPGKGLDSVAGAAPIGSGPYRLAAYDMGKRTEFVRDKNYWALNEPVRRGMYNFDRVVYRYYKDDAVRLEAFKAGEFDLSVENIAKNWARGYQGAKFDDGRIVKRVLPHGNGSGMQGFVLNMRRPLFKDIRVRQAMNLAFDFEWVNRQIFYDQYKRSPSYFTNSDLAASGLPSADELALLNPLRKYLPPDVFGPAVMPPVADSRYGVRDNLKRARQLLLNAGLRYQGGVLVDKNGQPVKFEFLSYSRTYERVTAKWQKDLAKIGITLNVRVVDPAVFQRRMQDFDYDITVVVYGASQSPGNEQVDFHSCAAAKQPGSQNWAGLCDPAVEALLPQFVHFKNRAQLITASRALDRVLRAGHYVVPNWYSPNHRAAWWNKFGQPTKLPIYYDVTSWALTTWWAK